MFESPRLAAFALTQPLVLLVAYLLGRVAQWVLRFRAPLSVSTTTVTSVLGICLGFLIAGAVLPNQELWSPAALGVAFAVDVAVLAAVSAIALSLAPPAKLPSISAQAAMGEGDRLEFKSSARINMRTGDKDERMELVIAKTIAAFCNSSGGTLLIGVDDEGELLGLAPDFATLKQPDPDRFELWLRDLAQARLGANAAALPQVDFEQLPDDTYVCRVVCPASTRPVFLRQGKGSSATTELWIRVGNSSRGLAIADAVEYVAQRWPVPVATAARHNLRNATRRWSTPSERA